MAEATETTLTFELQGETIPLSVFAEAVTHFTQLVAALSRDVAGKAALDWIIDDLSVGSALIATRSTAERAADVENAYETVARALERHEEPPFSPAVKKEASALTALLDGHVEALLMQTARDDRIIRKPDFENGVKVLFDKTAQKIAHGGVQGRIETLGRRPGLRFTLYDSVYDKPVSCYLAQGYEDIMRNAWGKIAIVEGLVTRDPLTGRPTSVRQVRNVMLIEEGERKAYKRARGAIQRGELSPEEEISRLRDE